MQAHLVQSDIVWENKPANHQRVEAMLARAPISPGDFVLLPEMFDTGFSLNVERTADLALESHGFIERQARALRVTVQAGITMKAPNGKGLNRALIVGPTGEILAQYDKVHPFSFGLESEHFQPGPRVTTFEWRSAPSPDGAGLPPVSPASLRVSPAICYDLRFPELFRCGLALGTEVYAIGANWPTSRVAHWRTLLIARAIENQAFVLAANRCGSDPHLEYPGVSIAIDPQGRVLAEAGAGEEILSVEIQPSVLHNWREVFPAWKDQSPALRTSRP